MGNPVRRLPSGQMPGGLHAGRIAELAEEVRRLADDRQHFVSHLSSNLDSVDGGFQQRSQGVSFARLPHERMSSPTIGEPAGRQGVVYASVGGAGLDYSRPAHRSAVDAVVEAAIDSGGTADDAYSAMRNAGVSWVNNWNGIGESPELYAIDPSAIDIRKVMELRGGRDDGGRRLGAAGIDHVGASGRQAHGGCAQPPAPS